MNLIFLDIDGVLNCQDFLANRAWRRDADGKRNNEICPDCVAQLNRILEATDAHIVISSTWRKFYGTWEIISAINKAGGKIDPRKVVGTTPVLDGRMKSGLYSSCPRGLEIQDWLDKTILNPSRFIILDDDDDMEHLKNHLIQAHPIRGLTEDVANAAITKLNRKI